MGTPGIDARNTKINHVIEVHETLGVEAARQSIIDEIHDTMRNHGMSIDKRHMMLLADVMTYKVSVRCSLFSVTSYFLEVMWLFK